MHKAFGTISAYNGHEMWTCFHGLEHGSPTFHHVFHRSCPTVGYNCEKLKSCQTLLLLVLRLKPLPWSDGQCLRAMCHTAWARKVAEQCLSRTRCSHSQIWLQTTIVSNYEQWYMEEELKRMASTYNYLNGLLQSVQQSGSPQLRKKDQNYLHCICIWLFP